MNKKGGLGAHVYFPVDEENTEMTQDEVSTFVDEQVEAEPTKRARKKSSAKGKNEMIRRTYYVKKETDKLLSEMRGQALVRGEKISVGELLEEAVNLLAKKRRVGE